MWIIRDFQLFLKKFDHKKAQPIKILKGPRQVGKTSVLVRNTGYKVIYFDDFNVRERARENPKLFLDQLPASIILDEATLVPELFLELKRRIDLYKRNRIDNPGEITPDIWITGSNQTLLEKNVQESLAGRASYFDLNTLSIHELKHCKLNDILLKGGWPELYVNPQLDHVSYLNDLISTFIEKDIVSAAGIEKKEAFVKAIKLTAGRIGQLYNASDVAKNIAVDVTTLKSWLFKLSQNAILQMVSGYATNLNQRLIKNPKIYFEDVGLASRFQGWSEFEPLYSSSQFGHLIENLALNEIMRFFKNSGLDFEIYYLRSKEKVEVDFLLRLSNNRWLACEVKTTPEDFTEKQIALLDSTNLKIVDKWVLTPAEDQYKYKNSRVVSFLDIYNELNKFYE